MLGGSEHADGGMSSVPLGPAQELHLASIWGGAQAQRKLEDERRAAELERDRIRQESAELLAQLVAEKKRKGASCVVRGAEYLVKHPGTSTTAVARAVGCRRETLARNPLFREARRLDELAERDAITKSGPRTDRHERRGGERRAIERGGGDEAVED